MKTKTYLLPTLVSTLLALSAMAQQGRAIRAMPSGDSGTLSSLRISDNGHYFVDRNGKPFFWQGDTEWELFRCFAVDEVKALMEKRRSQGFNVIQVMVTGVYPEQSFTEGAMKDAVPAESMQAWLDNDPLHPNESYFQRMDAIVKEAERCGMMLVVGVYHAKDQDVGRINTNNAGAWARFLAKRYKDAPNIVWSMYPHAKPSSVPVVRATAAGLREGDAGAHLITMHPDPSPTSSSYMHDEPWLGFNTLQTWHVGIPNYDMVMADYARKPAKVVVDGEARYEEEDRTTPLQARRAGYLACLAGGFYSYGHGYNWMSPRSPRQWWDSPGAWQMKTMGDVFRSLTWWKLVPDREILLNPSKGNVAARSSEGDWLLAYLTAPSSATVKMDKLTAGGTVEAFWINPTTGIKLPIGKYPNIGICCFTMPGGWEDAVLLCKTAEK